LHKHKKSHAHKKSCVNIITQTQLHKKKILCKHNHTDTKKLHKCAVRSYSSLTQIVEDYDVDVRNINNGVVDIRNNVVDKCCKQSKT